MTPIKLTLITLFSLLTTLPLHAQIGLSQTPARKLQIALFAITQMYVDSVNEPKLVEAAIVNMLNELDPHSTYSDPEEMKKLTEPLEGKFDGIGIQFNMVDDTLMVIQPVSGGPSEKAGILAGDRIIHVDGVTISGVKMSTDQIMRKLKGPKGTQVAVDVKRGNAPTLLPFTLTRDKIPMHSIDATYMLPDQIGYIRISRFAATTGKELKAALRMLKKQGMQSLVLDLQGNGGGYLNAATDVAGEFLPDQSMIVYTEGRKSKRQEYNATAGGDFLSGRVVVLIDEFSASAAEIVSGALQDWDRAIVVGRRSYGKGLVQRPIPLPDQSMIRLTVARYYTPSGRCIQKPYKDKESYAHDLSERLNHGELMSADSIHFPDSLRFQTLRLGRTVYGGGGIMPDYFVPLDTTLITPLYRKIRDKGLLLHTHYKALEKHRTVWKKQFDTFKHFDESFEVDDSLLQPILDEAKREGIDPTDEEWEKTRPLVARQMKALIARDLWDMNEYYQVMNAFNPSLTKAVELLHSPRYEQLFTHP